MKVAFHTDALTSLLNFHNVRVWIPTLKKILSNCWCIFKCASRNTFAPLQITSHCSSGKFSQTNFVHDLFQYLVDLEKGTFKFRFFHCPLFQEKFNKKKNMWEFQIFVRFLNRDICMQFFIIMHNRKLIEVKCYLPRLSQKALEKNYKYRFCCGKRY